MLLCQVKELLGAAIVEAHIVTESAAICHRKRGYYRRLRAAPRAQPSHKCSGVSSLAACPLHRSAPLRCAFTLSGTSSVLAADGSAGHELRPLRARLFCGRGRPFGSCPCRAARVADPRHSVLRVDGSGGSLSRRPRGSGVRAAPVVPRRCVATLSVFRAVPLRSALPPALPLRSSLAPFRAPAHILALGALSARRVLPAGPCYARPRARPLGYLGSGARSRGVRPRDLGVSASPPEPFSVCPRAYLLVRPRLLCWCQEWYTPPAPHTEGSEAQKHRLPLSRPRAICA